MFDISYLCVPSFYFCVENVMSHEWSSLWSIIYFLILDFSGVDILFKLVQIMDGYYHTN